MYKLPSLHSVLHFLKCKTELRLSSCGNSISSKVTESLQYTGDQRWA